jgi:hypothetical protein
MHLVDDEGGHTHSHAHTWYTAHTGEMQHIYIARPVQGLNNYTFLEGGRERAGSGYFVRGIPRLIEATH